MLTFPHINPVAFSLGPLQVHWYGLMYLVGFILAWLLAIWRNHHYQLGWTSEEIGDVIFYGALGVIIGGRLGYILFYGFPQFIQQPLSIFKLWQGGMSFHGGLLGVLIAIYLFARRYKKTFFQTTDFIAPLVPVGLGAGRIGNFINGELWGRITDVPWAMIFPTADQFPRHPSQLYEFFLEGIILFLVLWFYAAKKPATGRISALFLMGYALCRIIVECFREPDVQLGYLAFDWLTMGQLLSIPMLLLGLFLWWKTK